MKVLIVFTMLGLFVIPARAQNTKLTDQQKIELLRHEAHKRGLAWYDACARELTGTFDDPKDKQFFAKAWIKGTSESGFIEDGVKDAWAVFGDTQADAAYNLYLSIQHQPNMIAEHKPRVKAKKMMCPPELRGD